MQLRKKRRLLVVLVCFSLLALFIAWGCGPKTDSGDKPKEPEVVEDPYAESFTWSPEASCVVCHKKEGNLALETESARHISDEGNKCVDCHKASDVQDLHAGKTSKSKTPIRLLKTEILQDTCLASGCHVKADIIKATADSKVLTDKEGTVVNPHDPPENKHHLSEYNVTCSFCHQQHVEIPIAESAMNQCGGLTSCHHDQVFRCADYCHTSKMAA